MFPQHFPKLVQFWHLALLSPSRTRIMHLFFLLFDQEGGELYFSDIYADRELPQNIKEHKELWG